jgi:hypothetical protein
MGYSGRLFLLATLILQVIYQKIIGYTLIFSPFFNVDHISHAFKQSLYHILVPSVPLAAAVKECSGI